MVPVRGGDSKSDWIASSGGINLNIECRIDEIRNLTPAPSHENLANPPLMLPKGISPYDQPQRHPPNRHRSQSPMIS